MIKLRMARWMVRFHRNLLELSTTTPVKLLPLSTEKNGGKTIYENLFDLKEDIPTQQTQF